MTETQEQKFPIGTRVVFKSEFGISKRNGQTAEVVLHGTINDAGLPHLIRFSDGLQIAAYLSELIPADRTTPPVASSAEASPPDPREEARQTLRSVTGRPKLRLVHGRKK